MSDCKWNKLLVLLCVVIIMLCSLAGAEDKAILSKAGRVLVNEDYESDLDRKVQIEHASMQYELREIGLSTERARSCEHSAKIDVTYGNHFDVYLTPRRNEITDVLYGSVGGIGAFDIEGLNIELKPDRGYLLTLYVWVEQASEHNPARFKVVTTSNCDFGAIRSETLLEQEFTKPTGGWVKVEQELTSYVLEQLEAQGNQYEGIQVKSISMSSFSCGHRPLKVYVDDIVLKEVPMGVVAEYKAKRLATKKKIDFRSFPKQEDTFAWGVYGNLQAVGRDWYLSYPQPYAGEASLRERINRLGQMVDWVLLDLRRHYCNTQIQGGGYLFPGEPQVRYDYLKLALDKCAEYGIGWIPSTYLTQHYAKSATKEQCIVAMRKLTDMTKGHPGLFAYLLVDEPQPATAEDFYWGKQQMESLDTNHPCISLCNGITSVSEFAPVLPITIPDNYPLKPTPQIDLGAWSAGDMVKYARKSGAKRIWRLTQAFGGGSWRAVLAEEFRIQTYSCLAEGATGFLPFTYGGTNNYWYDKSFSPKIEMLDEFMVDVFGNPSVRWDEMKKLGPYLRSIGPLLIGSTRLEDNAVTAQVKEFIATSGGRRRPIAIAQMFKDNNRNVRYIVVYNNTRFYSKDFSVGIAEMGAGEKLLDLYSLRQVPLKGNTFREYLKPADGRVYALAPEGELADIKKEVATERFNIEHDLLKLEIRIAQKMGTDVALVRKVADDSKKLLTDGDFVGALEKVAEGMDVLKKQNSANIPFSKVNGAIEASRSALGRVNETMSRRTTGIENGFMGTDPGIKEVSDRMISLADRFYTIQTQLMQKGPAGLVDPIEVLLKDVQAFERYINTFFGI